MAAWRFDLGEAPGPGSVARGTIAWGDPVLTGWDWPYVAVHGARPGPAVVITAGYRSLLERTAADRSLAARSLAGLRALLFLIPTVVFTCAFVVCATMYFDVIPHQDRKSVV